MAGVTNECSFDTVGGGYGNTASGMYVVCLQCCCLARFVNWCCALRACFVAVLLHVTQRFFSSRRGCGFVTRHACGSYMWHE